MAGTKTFIHFPWEERKRPSIAFVHIHEDTHRFGECLTGKTIVYAKYAETELLFEGKSFTLINEDNVLAVLEETEPT